MGVDRMKSKLLTIIFSLSLSLFLFSCDSNNLFEDNKNIALEIINKIGYYNESYISSFKIVNDDTTTFESLISTSIDEKDVILIKDEKNDTKYIYNLGYISIYVSNTLVNKSLSLLSPNDFREQYAAIQKLYIKNKLDPRTYNYNTNENNTIHNISSLLGNTISFYYLGTKYKIVDFELKFTTVNGNLSSEITVSGKSWISPSERDTEKQLNYVFKINELIKIYD